LFIITHIYIVTRKAIISVNNSLSLGPLGSLVFLEALTCVLYMDNQHCNYIFILKI